MVVAEPHPAKQAILYAMVSVIIYTTIKIIVIVVQQGAVGRIIVWMENELHRHVVTVPIFIKRSV